MDLVMPVKTGFEATQELRQRPEFTDLVIIAISASVLEADREKSLVAGCNAFLPKPVHVDELLDALASHLTLNWIYAEPEAGAEGAAPLVPPPPEELTALHELILSGRIPEIQKHALRLAKMDAVYLPFSDTLQELARGFKIDKITALIEQFMEVEQDERT